MLFLHADNLCYFGRGVLAVYFCRVGVDVVAVVCVGGLDNLLNVGSIAWRGAFGSVLNYIFPWFFGVMVYTNRLQVVVGKVFRCANGLLYCHFCPGRTNY